MSSGLDALDSVVGMIDDLDLPDDIAELHELGATPEGAEDHYVTEEIETNERRQTDQ